MKTLERRLGLSAVIGISMGAMLGSGLFVLPGLAIAKTGSSVWLAYLVAGLCVLPAALSKAELATAMPVSGGTYVYIDRTLGPLASTIGGIGLWVSLLLKSAFALVGFAAYLSVMGEASVTVVGLSLLIAITALNIVGVRKVGKIQVWVVLSSGLGLLLLTLWGLTHAPAQPPGEFLTHGTLGFLTTVSFVYISYAGVTKVAAIAEEVENPDRNLPLGILLSLGMVTVLYALVTYGLVRAVPAEQLEGDLRPIHTLAQSIAPPVVATIAAVLALVTMTSMANAGLLAASRFPFAMGRDRLLPAALGYVSPRFVTPVAAIVTTASLMAAAILFLDVEKIAKLASSLMIVGFMVVNLAVIVLRESATQWYAPPYRTPLYPFTQIAGLVIGLALLLASGWTALAAIVVTFVPGFAIFASFGRQRTDRSGVLERLAPRRELLSEAQVDSAALPKKAAVVVPLLGVDRSPEALLEVGAALADGKKVEVVYLAEVPEQLSLEDLPDEDRRADALQRRVDSFAASHGHDMDFDSLVTRDVPRRIHDISRRVHCNWVVKEWHGKTQGGVLPFTPLGWLIDHLSCNLAIFKDAGNRTTKKIMVLAEPGPHDALVAVTADRLAQTYGAELAFVRWVEESVPSMVRQGEVDYLIQLSKLCHSNPAHEIAQGADPVRTLAELSVQYDLLIMGGPPDRRLGDLFRGTLSDKLTRAATCSVLLLKTPRVSTHESVPKPMRKSAPAAGRLVDFLDESCVEARIEATTKNALFAHFAEKFSGLLPDSTPKEIEEALWERERTQNTAIEAGMALPHATVASADRAYLGVFTTSEPVDYKAPDGKPVDVFFVTLGPPGERATHLRILARISERVLHSSLLDQLREASDPALLIQALAEKSPT